MYNCIQNVINFAVHLLEMRVRSGLPSLGKRTNAVTNVNIQFIKYVYLQRRNRWVRKRAKKYSHQYAIV